MDRAYSIRGYIREFKRYYIMEKKKNNAIIIILSWP
jgi:hypothetical protein